MPVLKSKFANPKLTLSASVNVSDSFRKKFNDYLLKRFGTKEFIYKVNNGIFENEAFITDSLTYEKLKESYLNNEYIWNPCFKREL